MVLHLCLLIVSARSALRSRRDLVLENVTLRLACSIPEI